MWSWFLSAAVSNFDLCTFKLAVFSEFPPSLSAALWSVMRTSNRKRTRDFTQQGLPCSFRSRLDHWGGILLSLHILHKLRVLTTLEGSTVPACVFSVLKFPMTSMMSLGKEPLPPVVPGLAQAIERLRSHQNLPKAFPQTCCHTVVFKKASSL